MPVQSSFQNPLVSGPNNVIHAPRLQTSLESQFSVPDTLTSPIKKVDSFHVASLPQTANQLHKSALPAPTPSILMSQDERLKGPAADPKEIMKTPPAVPRPHSSDSFFQISASPQSQLLASLDSHSQPSPASSKMLAKTVIESPKSSEAQSTTDITLPAKIPQQAPVASPNHPQLSPSVEQFVLQSPLTSANLVKQLSQYKETFGSITNTARTLLTSEKPIEQQNLEQFLQEGLSTYPKAPQQQQQLKDLLQNKKFCNSEAEESKDGESYSF